ncbi:MAG TPA: hypothetical protein VN157_13440 [Caulobacter sp.]|nr:hypothetical protein [Caulobacter sp.]
MKPSNSSFAGAARLAVGLGLIAQGLAGCATSPRRPPDPVYLTEICDLLSAPGDPEIEADKAKGTAAARIAEIERRLTASSDGLSAKKGRGAFGQCPSGGYWSAFVALRISPDRAYASREALGPRLLEWGPCFYEKVDQRWRLVGCRVDGSHPSLVT